MRLLSALGCLLVGCAAAEPPPARPSSAVATAPACPPGSTDAPSDAHPRMAGLQADVRKCYALSTGAGDGEVKVEITIGATGVVRAASVLGSKGEASARACLEQTLRSVRFAAFCGPDISIRWTYTLR